MCKMIFFLILLPFDVAGASAECPLELNPTSVVLRHGDSVSVNCSTSSTTHDDMGWETSQGSSASLDNNTVTWTVENLTDWHTEPKCYINIDEQCFKKLVVVLYKPPDRVSISPLNHSGPMVEGTEYQLQCDVLNVAPVQNLTVIWYKGKETIKTDSYNDQIKTPVNTSSILTITPNRTDDGAQYRCEAKLNLGPDGPQYSNTSSQYAVTVYYGPDILCSRLDIVEGQSLEGSCLTMGNPSPIIVWQNINASAPLSRGQTGLYSLNAEGFSTINKEILVSVLYGPEIHCPNAYIAHQNAPHNLTCNAVGHPKPKTIWWKDGENVTLPEVLSWRDAGQYVIVAINNISTVTHTLDIEIQYPPSVMLELEDTVGNVGSTFGLKCSSRGNPRPDYIWTYYTAPNVKVENMDGVSLLSIHNATGENIGSYTCYARNKLGNVSETVRVSVKGAKAVCPITINPPKVVVMYKGSVSVSCNGTSSLEHLYWSPGSSGQNDSTWEMDSLSDWNSKPWCVGKFPGIGECRKVLDITLYKPPDRVSISPLNHSGPVVEGTEYQLQCDVLNIAPVQNLTVIWYKGKETMKTDSYNDQIKTPVNTSSILTITPSRVDDGAQYRCEAQLNLGPDRHPSVTSDPFTITVYYKPRINATKLPERVPLFRGYPEKLVCEAEGYPQPKIKWYYNTMEIQEAHEAGGNLTVKEGGLYNCTATNDVQTAFIVVQVVLKEDYLPLIAGFVAVTVVVISVIFVFIYSIYYKNTKMGRYSLKDAKLNNTQKGNVAQNGRDMPLPMTKLAQPNNYF